MPSYGRVGARLRLQTTYVGGTAPLRVIAPLRDQEGRAVVVVDGPF